MKLRSGHIWYRALTYHAETVMGTDGVLIVGPANEGVYDICWYVLTTTTVLTLWISWCLNGLSLV